MSYQVKEITRITGVDRETLRFYENKGLVHPKRKESGYRVYDENDVRKIDFILKNKKAGFTLSEIKSLLNFKKRKKVTCKKGKEIAQNKLAEVKEKIKALKEIERILKRFSDKCDEIGLEESCCLNFYCCGSRSLKP